MRPPAGDLGGQGRDGKHDGKLAVSGNGKLTGTAELGGGCRMTHLRTWAFGSCRCLPRCSTMSFTLTFVTHGRALTASTHASFSTSLVGYAGVLSTRSNETSDPWMSMLLMNSSVTTSLCKSGSRTSRRRDRTSSTVPLPLLLLHSVRCAPVLHGIGQKHFSRILSKRISCASLPTASLQMKHGAGLKGCRLKFPANPARAHLISCFPPCLSATLRMPCNIKRWIFLMQKSQ